MRLNAVLFRSGSHARRLPFALDVTISRTHPWAVSFLAALAVAQVLCPSIAAARIEPPAGCEPGWEQGFPPVGTAYTDPLTGCTGVYEIVYGDRVVTPGRGDVAVGLKMHPEFSNNLCWATTATYGESVETCDDYTISGAATVGGGIIQGVEADAGIVFAAAKAKMEVSYSAQFTAGASFRDSKCETTSWSVASPHPKCTVLTYRVFAASQPTWAEATHPVQLRIRFVDGCDVNGSEVVHACAISTRADLVGAQCPVAAPGAGWNSWPIPGCNCPGSDAGNGASACVERPRIFSVASASGLMFKLSINEWIGGQSTGCELDWVDQVLPDQNPTVAIERIDG